MTSGSFDASSSVLIGADTMSAPRSFAPSRRACRWRTARRACQQLVALGVVVDDHAEILEACLLLADREPRAFHRVLPVVGTGELEDQGLPSRSLKLALMPGRSAVPVMRA